MRAGVSWRANVERPATLAGGKGDPSQPGSGADGPVPPDDPAGAGSAEQAPVEIAVAAGDWRLHLRHSNGAGPALFVAELVADVHGNGTREPAWTTRAPTFAELEESLGWTIPQAIRHVLLRQQPDRPSRTDLPDHALSASAARHHQPTRTSVVRAERQPPVSYGRLLHRDRPAYRFEQDNVRIDLHPATDPAGDTLGYRISEAVPGQPPVVMFSGIRDDVPAWEDADADTALFAVLISALQRVRTGDITRRQHDFLGRHQDLILTIAAGPPDEPYPPGTAVLLHAADPDRRTTGTVLAAVDDTAGQSYLIHPDAASLPGHPWRGQPTWTLRAGPWHVQATLTRRTVDRPDTILATGAIAASVDHPRFEECTILRAFDDDHGRRYEVQPHAPLPRLTLPADDLAPLRGTAWPTVTALLAARATAGLPPQPGELLVTLRETAIVTATPTGPGVTTLPSPNPPSPALDPAGTCPIPAPAHPAGPGLSTATLRQDSQGTLRIDDPFHGQLLVDEDLFNQALRHPPDQLTAMLTRRPWLPPPHPTRPLLVTAALAALHAADELRLGPPSAGVTHGTADVAPTTATPSADAQIDKTTSDYDREKLQERLAKLSGGVAVIRVGAPSEAEMKSRKEALDDAISATKAAVAEGIVRAAGWRCCGRSRRWSARRASAKATSGPDCRSFAARSNTDPPDRRELVGRRRRGGRQMRPSKGNLGFDAARKEYVDLVEAGIIDPTKVVRVALENAVSVASLLLLTEATLTEVPEKKDDRAGGHGLEEM